MPGLEFLPAAPVLPSNRTNEPNPPASIDLEGGAGENKSAQNKSQPSASPIVERQAANASLSNSPKFAEDMRRAGISREQLEWMQKKQAPLGFADPAQYQQFKTDLAGAFHKSGLDDAEVGMKGTATTFYSENPGKALGHFWDADPANPGDYDLNLTSKKMVQAMDNAHAKVSSKYGIFRTADIEHQFPHLESFSEKWSSILGRDVNIVGYPANTSPARDLSEFIVVEK